jgi:hypothetical protein
MIYFDWKAALILVAFIGFTIWWMINFMPGDSGADENSKPMGKNREM